MSFPAEPSVFREATMLPFTRFAFFTIARDAGYVTLAAATLMLAFSFAPPLAFEIGATVALIFAIGLICRAFLLTEVRFLKSEAWQALQPDERPAGEHGRRLARAQFEELLLRAAKISSGISGILYLTAPVLSAGGAPIAL